MNPLTKKLAWLLALSVGLNLFLLGFGVARRVGPPPFVAQPGVEPDHDHHGPKGMHMFGPHAAELRTQRLEVVSAREAVAQALTREPFDKEALVVALSNLRNVTAAGQLKMHQVLLETAPGMSVAQRSHLAHSRLLNEVPGKR